MRFAAFILCLLAAGPARTTEPPSIETILERALAVAERARENDLELRYRWRHINVTRRPGGESAEKSRDVYRVYPRDGEPFYELIEHNGKPATPKDLAREAELRAKFRDRVGGRGGIAFDHDLVERYQVRLEGRSELHGRSAWILAFSPLDDPPSVERPVDYALNHSRGRFWIDVEDYGLARIDFELQEDVSIWAGILGSIKVFEGNFEQQRVEPGGWLPRSMELRMEGRALFSSLDQNATLAWTDYERVEEASTGL